MAWLGGVGRVISRCACGSGYISRRRPDRSGRRDGHHLRGGERGVQLSVGGEKRMIQPHHNRLAAAVEVEVPHGEAQRAVGPEAAKDALEIAEAVERDRLIDRPTGGASDEGGDGCGNTGEGVDAAGQFFDIDSRVT